MLELKVTEEQSALTYKGKAKEVIPELVHGIARLTDSIAEIFKDDRDGAVKMVTEILRDQSFWDILDDEEREEGETDA